MKKTKSHSMSSSERKPNAISKNLNLVNLIFTSKLGSEKITTLDVQVVNILEPYVSVKNFFSNSALFFNIKHNQLQTLIDLSDLSNLYILGFNENSNFVGVSIIGEKSNAPFQILSQSKFHLIIGKEIKIDFRKLKGMRF
jgi:hypothetical protein